MPLAVTSNAKRKIIGVVTLIILFAILGSILIFERPQDPDMIDYKAQVKQIFKDAKTQFEHLRSVTLPANIKISVYTKQQAIDKWGKDPLNTDTANIARQENIYKSLFLMNENESLNGTTADWVASWTAVTVDNEIYVIYENFRPWDMPNAEAILIHELTHVWQNNLPLPTNSDNARAQNALIEGDASYMADYYYTTQNNNNNNNLNHQNDYHNILPTSLNYIPKQNSIYPNVLDTVTNLNWFPYIQGKTFVSTIMNTYGWDKLNQCYTTHAYTPSSTTQILHPNKYFTGETAKNVPTPTPNDDNWTIIPSSYGYSSDTYGEYFIYLMLKQWLNDDQAQTASVGWSGDNFVYYEKDQDFLFTWNITWDSIQDALEFNQAFTDMLKLTQAKPQNTNNNQWLTDNRYLTLTWNPNTATTLIICSTNQTATNPLSFYI
jgi:hypothetical protein